MLILSYVHFLFSDQNLSRQHLEVWIFRHHLLLLSQESDVLLVILQMVFVLFSGVEAYIRKAVGCDRINIFALEGF